MASRRGSAGRWRTGAYFPESDKKSGKQVEVGLIGREGMTGLPIVFGNHRSPHAKPQEGATRARATPCRTAVELENGVQITGQPCEDTKQRATWWIIRRVLYGLCPKSNASLSERITRTTNR
jgi:hypothetical protein